MMVVVVVQRMLMKRPTVARSSEAGNCWPDARSPTRASEPRTEITRPKDVTVLNLDLMGPAYVAIVCLYLTATALTLCIVAPVKPQAAGEAASEALQRSPLRDLREGVTYCWTTPRMQAALWVAFLANLTAYPLTNGLLPYIAKAIYGTNQTGLGYLSASFAIGSLAGSIVLSLIRIIRVARLMIGATVVWYVTLLVFVQMQTVPTAIA